MNIVYWFSFEDRIKNKTPPYYYIGSKLNCTVVNSIIYDSKGKEYWSSCKQSRFLEAVNLEKPKVSILIIDGDPIPTERLEQFKVKARDNPMYFNLVYAGGGFGVSGDTHPAKRPEVKEHMKSSNYMNQDDFRPWKTSRADLDKWKYFHLVFDNYTALKTSELFNGKIGWRRCSSGLPITTTTAKSMLKWICSGYNPYEDELYIKFALS